MLAERWCCSKSSIFRMIKRGDLPTIDFPHVRISMETVERIERGNNSLAARVYAMEGGGLVKIGFTQDIIYRLRCIRAMSPVPITLIIDVAGTRQDEKALHRRFAAYRSHGEWFRIEGAVAAWIEAGCPL